MTGLLPNLSLNTDAERHSISGHLGLTDFAQAYVIAHEVAHHEVAINWGQNHSGTRGVRLKLWS